MLILAAGRESDMIAFMTNPLSDLTPFGLPFSLAPESSPPVEGGTVPRVSFPILWILANDKSAIAYRSLSEVAGFGADDERVAGIRHSTLGGLTVLMMQEMDGTWSSGMLSVPTGNTLLGVGTIPSYRRLLELGWSPELPGLTATKRLLFRLLAEDNDESLLFELGASSTDEELIIRSRKLLREAAAAALATAGFEGDPRLRGAARRMLDRTMLFLQSPLAQKPWIRSGNQHLLAPDATPPSFHFLTMLAHMPLFRSEHHVFMDRLYNYLSQPWPRQQPMQQVGSHLIEQSHYVLGDLLPTRNVMDADMPSSLAWLEIVARLGFLHRNDNWTRLLDRLLDDRDRNGVWHPPRSVTMPELVPVWSWPLRALSDSSDKATAFSVDVTFRLGLIAKLSGREIELI